MRETDSGQTPGGSARSLRFSGRLPWQVPPNRLTLALEARRRSGARIVDLTQSNPTQAGFVYPDSIREALANPGVLRYEPTPAGLRSAREAVASYYAERGATIDPDRILLASGTSEAYAWLFKLLCDAGDEVLTPRPSYPLFEFLTGLENVRMAPYPLVYEGRWRADLDALRRAAGPRTRAVVVVQPNNPTGSILEDEAAAELTEFCAARGLALISDEVFSDYLWRAETRLAPLCERPTALTFSLNGLSKSVGLPQMKLSWIVAGGPETLRREALRRLEWIADSYLTTGTPVQVALPRLLEAGSAVREQIRRRITTNRTLLASLLGRYRACQVLEAEGGWYAVLRVPRTRSEEQWCLELLERFGVLVQPGFFFDFFEEAYLVVSLLTEPELLAEGVQRMCELAES